MRASIVTVQQNFVLAECAQGTALCLPTQCSFDIADAVEGDRIEIDAVEPDERGLKAIGVRWVSRSTPTPFIGTVTDLLIERGFGFALSDAGAKVYLHCYEFTDFVGGRSETFETLRVGDHVHGEWHATSKGPRGMRLERAR